MNISAFFKYDNPATSGNTVAGVATMIAGNVATGATGELAEVADIVVNDPGLISNLIFSGDNSRPKAYIHYLYFDKDYNYQRGGMAQVSTTTGAFQELSLQFTADREGYVLIYTANQTAEDLDVFIDDLLVEHIESPVIRTDDYYPFGLAFNSAQRTGVLTNKYLYNGKELQSDLNLDWYDYGARMYDAAIGRWSVVDNLSEKYHMFSPYHYAGNNPIRNIDIDGNEFTDEAWKWIHKMLNSHHENIERDESKLVEVNSQLANDNLTDKERGKLEKKAGRISGRLDNEYSKLGEVLGEVATLSASNQLYDVQFDNSYSDAKTYVAAADFDFSSGTFVVKMPSGGSVEQFAHEFKHAVQFESGEYSIGPPVSAGPKNLFYDKHDEVAAYTRQGWYGSKEGVTSVSTLPERYDRIETGPVDATSHPIIKRFLNKPDKLRRYSKSSGHAFRINGTTYY